MIIPVYEAPRYDFDQAARDLRGPAERYEKHTITSIKPRHTKQDDLYLKLQLDGRTALELDSHLTKKILENCVLQEDYNGNNLRFVDGLEGQEVFLTYSTRTGKLIDVISSQEASERGVYRLGVDLGALLL